MMRYKTLMILILTMVSAGAKAALLNIVIDGGQVGGIPVAVVPFAAENCNKSEIPDIGQIVHADLRSSGQFRPLPAQELHQFPSQSAQVELAYWQGLKVEDLVVGRIRKTGTGRYTVNFELLNVVQANGSNKPLLSMQFDNIQPQEFRALAHHISDRIFEKVVGVKGFFSTRIAYITSTNVPGAPKTLEVADYDGHNPKTVFRSNYPIMSPKWSPDGKKIAFVSFEKERSSILVVDLQTGRVERVTQYPGLNSAPTWSPDGRTLALVLSKDGSPKIYLLELASKRLTRLTDGGGIDTEPNFASDGRSIVFTSDRGGKPQVYRVILGTGKVERLTFEGLFNASPSLTPDGERLITLHRGEEGLFSIAVHSLKHGGRRILTQTGLNDSPTLAPNGMMVIYGTQVNGHKVLGAVTLDGRLKIRLPGRDVEVQQPTWSPFTF